MTGSRRLALGFFGFLTNQLPVVCHLSFSPKKHQLDRFREWKKDWSKAPSFPSGKVESANLGLLPEGINLNLFPIRSRQNANG